VLSFVSKASIDHRPHGQQILSSRFFRPRLESGDHRSNKCVSPRASPAHSRWFHRHARWNYSLRKPPPVRTRTLEPVNASVPGTHRRSLHLRPGAFSNRSAGAVCRGQCGKVGHTASTMNASVDTTNQDLVLSDNVMAGDYAGDGGRMRRRKPGPRRPETFSSFRSASSGSVASV
jgi:hypothetical protein